MRAGFVATGLIAAAATLALQSCSSKKSDRTRHRRSSDGRLRPSTSAGADSATADGSIAHPYPRIQIAIYEAFSRGKRNVLIASGTYPGSITLVSKISVRGGFNPRDLGAARFGNTDRDRGRHDRAHHQRSGLGHGRARHDPKRHIDRLQPELDRCPDPGQFGRRAAPEQSDRGRRRRGGSGRGETGSSGR